MTLQDARLAGIGHENFQIRSVALGVLANEREPGDGVAMRAIRQIEKYGWREAFEFPHQIRELPHSEESVEWVAAWLEQSAPTTMREEQQVHLAAWFCEAPVKWLLPRDQQEKNLAEVRKQAFELAQNPNTGLTVRVTALSIAGDGGGRDVKELAADLAKNPDTPVILRNVAERVVGKR